MSLSYTAFMRKLTLTVPLLPLLLSACGQTGPLYLPDEGVRTPVEIRTPEEIEKEKKEKPAQPPPGG